MPTITHVQSNPTPARLEHPLTIEISLRVPSAGPVTIQITLDETLPYFFMKGGKNVRKLQFTRTLGSAGDHTVGFAISLMRASQSQIPPSLHVTAAGIDGSSVPFTIRLGVE